MGMGGTLGTDWDNDMSAAFVKISGLKKTRHRGAWRSYCERSRSFYREAFGDRAALSETTAYQQSRSIPSPQTKPNRTLLQGLLCISLLGLSGCQADDVSDATAASQDQATSQSSNGQLSAPKLETDTDHADPSNDTSTAPASATLTHQNSGPTILVFGDSISAAYGIERKDGWAALLQARLSRAYPGARTINASVSGETTQGGRARLQAALTRHRPDLVYIELGGNDALRGYPVEKMSDNLKTMVTAAQNNGARVVLLGMQIPPNYGPRYTQDFAAAFAQVASATGAYLVPFFLEGVALEANMIQSDGIHPTTLAQPILLETGWRALIGAIGERYPALSMVAP